ncbi:U-scoloptoxin(01)-Cw1a [Procambarus clarkii]|uniref:U-scoloptoxin(01)-Cw1a n=1 Tax=Procambarus clarkii TaxID=6728 RepID=UPI001E675BF3|nr:U-scoloptoxin(01)-Cw1a-like [Procambarus clarkii]
MKLVLTLLGALVAATSARMAGKLPGGFRIESGFSCQGREYGYYADVQNRCSAYHICNPVYDDEEKFVELAHFSFLCGPGTIFDQKLLACTHPKKAYPCAEAETIYDSSNYQLRAEWEDYKLKIAAAQLS